MTERKILFPQIHTGYLKYILNNNIKWGELLFSIIKENRSNISYDEHVQID